MKSTLIRLPEDRLHELRARAAREGKSTASLVREAVDAYLGRTPGAPAVAPVDPFAACIGAWESSDDDAAESHDHHLYGWQREAPLATVRRHQRRHRPGRSR